MNKFTVTLIATLALAGAAQAQEATSEPVRSTAMSSVTRADVQAQAVAALKSGAIEFGEGPRFESFAAASSLTRAQVQAEAREALRLGLLHGGDVTLFPSAADAAAIMAAGSRADAPAVAAR